MESLFEYSRKLIDETETAFVRYLFHRINWENKLLGLTGPRGVGKTTMILQYIKAHLPVNKTLYVTGRVDQRFKINACPPKAGLKINDF